MFCARLAGHFNLASTTVLLTSPSILISSSSQSGIKSVYKRFAASLSPQKITELLARNEIHIGVKNAPLPPYIKSIECNQLASNSPIEDRIRISTIKLPDSDEPSVILGVFDGHGGGTTADLISRRLFNYIALSLHPSPDNILISSEHLKDMVVDLYESPLSEANARLQGLELDMLTSFRSTLSQSAHQSPDRHLDIATNLKESFQRCDDDLSKEIQVNLVSASANRNVQALRHYLSATVSGCCAIVMVVHRGFAYLASAGDCRAVLGVHEKLSRDQPTDSSPHTHTQHSQARSFRALELNDEHNCDNINEIRRLAAAHPKTEQNTMIKHNRLLGHLMPFRAFGDFNYKWPAEVIKECGITRAFGPGVIPSSYETPPYLIVEPDVKAIEVGGSEDQDRYLVMASDGLWELFESSRDVIEAIVDHSMNSNINGNQQDYDTNCATHILRSALCFGPHQDISLDPEKLQRLKHIRLESTLTLPSSVVRNFRDDISVILLKL